MSELTRSWTVDDWRKAAFDAQEELKRERQNNLILNDRIDYLTKLVEYRNGTIQRLRAKLKANA